MERYPQLVYNITHLKENVSGIVKRCNEKGVFPYGVIKGVNADPVVCQAYVDGGLRTLGSSRIEHLKFLKEKGIGDELILVRIPMLSEVEDVIKYSDISLNSNMTLLKALNEEAGRQGKVHKVILMVEVGDLREGYWDREELAKDAITIENELKNLYLLGTGTNVGCYGSVMPTKETLQELVDASLIVEEAIGRKLDIISGGATTSLMRVYDGDMPERINNIRIGGEPLVAYTLKHVYGYDLDWQHEDVIKLRAEIIEIRKKPSHPIGTLGVDAFGHTLKYEDRGIRTRALLGIGKFDMGDPMDIPCVPSGIEILGGSSDHTIVDLENADKEYKVGDIIELRIKYGQMMYMSNSPNVNVKYEY